MNIDSNHTGIYITRKFKKEKNKQRSKVFCKMMSTVF